MKCRPVCENGTFSRSVSAQTNQQAIFPTDNSYQKHNKRGLTSNKTQKYIDNKINELRREDPSANILFRRKFSTCKKRYVPESRHGGIYFRERN